MRTPASYRPTSRSPTASTLTLGGKHFQMIFAGPAHSASDMMMMVEPDGVPFAGDIVQNGRIPFMNSDDVDTRQWLKALEVVEQLDPKFIIPGHGRPSTAAKDAIAFTRDYIRFVRSHDDRRRGEQDRLRGCLPADRLVELSVTPAFDANNPGNAYRIFLELEQAQFQR